MDRSVALTLALALGCATAHELPSDAHLTDAGPNDASIDAPTVLEWDAGLPDTAPPCPDEDGDGYADGRCGGADCDDADPGISPTAGPCAGPTRAIRCRGSESVVVDCDDATPECDARTGACVAVGEACGDGVRQPSEVCDDGNSTPRDGCQDCEYSWCYLDADCRLPEAPFCTHRVGGTLYCQPGNPGGLPLGATCAEDADCEADWCDTVTLRCSTGCAGASLTCPPDDWCGATAFIHMGSGSLSSVCYSSCYRPSDCPTGTACTIARGPLFYDHASHSVAATFCGPEMGTRDLGDPCTMASDCRSNVCLCASPRCAGGLVCSQVCANDSDCSSSALPTCSDLMVNEPRPAPWLTPWVRVCTVR